MIYTIDKHLPTAINGLISSCNMGMSGLPDMSTRAAGDISGRPPMPVLQQYYYVTLDNSLHRVINHPSVTTGFILYTYQKDSIVARPLVTLQLHLLHLISYK